MHQDHHVSHQTHATRDLFGTESNNLATQYGRVQHMATEHRSEARAHKLSLRLSTQDVEQLRRIAADEGYASIQQLFEARLFGEARPQRKPGPQGPRRKPQNEQLEMSA